MRAVLAILSFFIPIIGVIVGFARKEEEDVGIYFGCAALGFVFNVISFLLM